MTSDNKISAVQPGAATNTAAMVAKQVQVGYSDKIILSGLSIEIK